MGLAREQVDSGRSPDGLLDDAAEQMRTRARVAAVEPERELLAVEGRPLALHEPW